MALEKPFIESHIFYSDNMRITQFNNLINQEEWETMRELFFNICKLKYRRPVGIIHGNIPAMLILFNVLLDFFCKFHITAMTRTVGNNSGFDWIAYQCKITYNIEQFMTCRLVGKS